MELVMQKNRYYHDSDGISHTGKKGDIINLSVADQKSRTAIREILLNGTAIPMEYSRGDVAVRGLRTVTRILPGPEPSVSVNKDQIRDYPGPVACLLVALEDAVPVDKTFWSYQRDPAEIDGDQIQKLFDEEEKVSESGNWITRHLRRKA